MTLLNTKNIYLKLFLGRLRPVIAVYNSTTTTKHEHNPVFSTRVDVKHVYYYSYLQYNSVESMKKKCNLHYTRFGLYSNYIQY